MSFGESHGIAVGGVLDGFPPGIPVDIAFIRTELARRRPVNEIYSTSRNETDDVEIISGLYEGVSTGAPIGFLIHNKDQRPADYSHLRDTYRPSHADFTYQQKYGIRDPRGGGRSSARETAVRVAAGALARILLQRAGITVSATVTHIGPFTLEVPFTLQDGIIPELEPVVRSFLETLKSEGDTTGGIIECRINGVPPGVGEPVYDKLQADLAKAMLSINAVKGFEYGSGFQGASMRGSAHNDKFIRQNGKIVTETNFSGGMQGGISNGMEIFFRVAFKPVSTLMKDQAGINAEGDEVTIQPRGRHDVCVVPRALSVVEAMAALVIADQMLTGGFISRR